MKTAKDVMAFIKENDIKMVDLRFTDLPGLWHHFSMLAKDVKEDMFEEGVGFDGSSIRGFKTIDVSDMILIPDPVTASPKFMEFLPELQNGNINRDVLKIQPDSLRYGPGLWRRMDSESPPPSPPRIQVRRTPHEV